MYKAWSANEQKNGVYSMIRIAVDAMGGDLAPDAILSGVVNSLPQVKDTKIFLFGPEALLRDKLKQYQYDESRIEIVDAPDVISLHESPVLAVRRKKDSSIVKGMHFVKEGNADAFISAGSSGAILAGGQLIVGRIKGIQRPPLGALIPTRKGVCLLVDCGANVDAKPEWLRQFAEMGSIYIRDMLGVKNPTVGLVNIGAEEEKGNALVKEAMPLLKEDNALNFIGSVEARDIVDGNCDVVVADAFVGNVVLKMYEGVGKMLLTEITDTLKHSGHKTLLGAALIKPALKKTMKKFDAKQYGGAPILGLKGLVVKVHGNTDGRELTTAIRQCADFVKKDIVKKIQAQVEAAEAEA